MRFKDNLQRELYYRSQIDYCCWFIELLAKDNKSDPFFRCKLAIQAMRDIIRLKKRFGFEYNKDEESLKELITKREEIKKSRKETKGNE